MKSKPAQFFLTLFFLAGFGNLISQWFGIETLEKLTKPLLMILLLLFYVLSHNKPKDTPFKLTIIALIFSWFGDLFLMFESSGEHFFLLGLGSFLVAHLFYIVDFSKLKLEIDTQPSKGFVNLRIIFLVFVGTSLYYLVSPGLRTYSIPVMVYMVVILAMAMSAVLRKGRTSEQSFIMIYGGALLFVFSDSIIALDKFLNPITKAGFWIMITYIAAQYLIVKGILAHSDFKEGSLIKPVDQ